MAASDALPRPRKRFGQHFLTDASAVQRIVRALGPASGPPVLEIGPGRGALTGALIAAFGHVTAVEIDRDLAGALRRRFPAERFALIEADVLDVSFLELASRAGGPLRIVGNLPYNVSKPVADKLVRERASVASAVLMFQREVADRLTARPGTRAYGPQTVLVGEAYDVRRVVDLPASSFRPAPRVTSTVTQWTPRPQGLGDDEEAALRAVLGASFAQRRRTLRNNIARALSDEAAAALLEAAGIDGGLRAEALAPEAFRRLSARWPTRAGGEGPARSV